MKVKNLEKKKVLILGLGKEGRSALRFLLETFPKKKIGLADQLKLEELDKKTKDLISENKKRLELNLGKKYLNAFSKYKVIIKSPGIPPHEIKNKLNKSHVLTSGTQLFLENCPGKVVGITATKGKSTTSTLIHRILKNNGLKSHLVGNIGTPALSLLKRAEKEDIYVYELSSHQLFQVKNSPHISVFLNIFPEHLNWHQTFKNYFNSKANITRHQTKKDFFIYNPKVEKIEELSKKTKAKSIPINQKKEGFIWKAFKESSFPADFYFLNVSAAAEVSKLFLISDKDIAKEIKEFKTLEHRLEKVGTYKGITFYNDSLATNPNATIAALNSLGEKVETLIVGGYERKGIDFAKLGQKIGQKRIKNLILFPPTGNKIWKAIPCNKRLKIKKFEVKNMEKAVQISYKNTSTEKICLLSNASASFGIFKNYKERGNLFKKNIKKIGNND